MAARIAVAGSLNYDLMAYVPHLPRAGEAVSATALRRDLGGKGFNQAVALRRLGAEVEMAGAVGRDGFGDEFRAALAALGIGRDRVLRADGPTGLAVPMIDPDGENCIVVALGANLELDADQVDAGFLEAADALLVQGELRPETTLALARRAADRGIPVVLNAAPASQALDPVAAVARLVVLNEGEAAATGGPNWLLALGAKAVVVTLGSAGARLYEGRESLHLPAPSVEIRDTTGAGDAFTAALTLALAEGRAPAEAVAWAVAAGAVACTRTGTSASMPTREEVDALSGKMA